MRFHNGKLNDAGCVYVVKRCWFDASNKSRAAHKLKFMWCNSSAPAVGNEH